MPIAYHVLELAERLIVRMPALEQRTSTNMTGDSTTNHASSAAPSSPPPAHRQSWLVCTLLWCPPLLVVLGLFLGHVPLLRPLWLPWWVLAVIVLAGWVSSFFTSQYVEPTIPPDDLPHLPAFLSLCIVGALAALFTGSIAASLDNHVTRNLAANPVHRFAALIGITAAGVGTGMGERLSVARTTAYSFTIGAVIGLLLSNSIGFFVVFTLSWAAGAVRYSIIFRDKQHFLKREPTRWKTWEHRVNWIAVWFSLILVPAGYVVLIVLCLVGRGHW
jgi:hypothetical protein